jgi:hypothetical protein
VPHAETYIVRIYRPARDTRQTVSGVVEVVRDGLSHRFASFEELCAILTVDSFGESGAGKSGEDLIRSGRRRR